MRYLERGLANADRESVTDSNGSWSYGELSKHTTSVAEGLKDSQGWRTGNRVGLFLPRCRESVALFLGVLGAGGVVVPLSVRATAREIAYEILDAGISHIVTDMDRQQVVADALDQVRERAAIPVQLNVSPLLNHHPMRRQIEVEPDAAALILYTSGTTGTPKGVVHTNTSLIAQVDSLYQAWEWSEADRLLHILPLHHIHGLVNGLLGALWSGGTLRFRESFTPADVWEAFGAEPISVFYAVPTIYHQLAEAWERAESTTQQRWSTAAGKLRLAVSGSAALPARLWHRWREITGHALLERYGMTEIGMAISNPFRGERRPGTVGQPLPGLQVRIVAETGDDAPAGIPGEIVVTGPTLFREYWNQPEATRDAFRAGFFRTGDVAEIENGYICIRGRASVDILKSAGYKLSALEIEEVLREHPAICEVAVVGVPDPQWGEVATACVVLHSGKTLLLEQLRTWCQDKLASYKIPRRLEIREALPRNSLGKVTKPELVRQLTD